MGRAPAFPSGGRASVIRPRSRATYWPSVHIFWRSSAPQNTAQQCLRVRRGKIPFQPCSAFPVRTGRGLLRRRIDQRAAVFRLPRAFGELQFAFCAGALLYALIQFCLYFSASAAILGVQPAQRYRSHSKVRTRAEQNLGLYRSRRHLPCQRASDSAWRYSALINYSISPCRRAYLPGVSPVACRNWRMK